MLFRFIIKFINLSSYLNVFFSFLIARFSYREEDYSRFLEIIFINLIFKPLNEIIKFFIFCFKIVLFILYTLLVAIHFVVHLFLIILPFNLINFIVSFKYDLRYLFIEFVFVFVDAYILSFKYSIKSFYYDICSDIKDMFYAKTYEVDEDEYENYKNSLKTSSAPDLKVYYPMRFALTSVMIRLTGVILSISLFLILFFNFINIFIIGDLNFSELRQTMTYKFIEFFNNYKSDSLKYSNVEKYNNATFYSTVKCIFIIIFLYVKACINYLIFDAYNRFNIMEILKTKSLIFCFFYNFFYYIFIYVLPIHLYYVIIHSYKLISITKIIKKLFGFIKTFVRTVHTILTPSFRGVNKFFLIISTIEEPAVKQLKILVKLKKYEIQLVNYINKIIKNEVVKYVNEEKNEINSNIVKNIFEDHIKSKK